MKAARPDMGEMFGEDGGRPAETPSSASKEMDSNGSTTEETEVANGNSDTAPTENGDPRVEAGKNARLLRPQRRPLDMRPLLRSRKMTTTPNQRQ
jgi:hypothetical protein